MPSSYDHRNSENVAKSHDYQPKDKLGTIAFYLPSYNQELSHQHGLFSLVNLALKS